MLIVFFDSRHGDLHSILDVERFVQPVCDLMRPGNTATKC